MVDATMSAVRAASHTGGTVALDVRDVKVFDFKALHLSVGLGVTRRSSTFDGLTGQRLATVGHRILRLRMPSATTGHEWDRLQNPNILEISLGFDQRHARWHGTPRESP